MKNTLILTILAAALLGGQVFAEPVVYRVSDYEDDSGVGIYDSEATVIVDIQKTLAAFQAWEPRYLTLDYQGDFELTATYSASMPAFGPLNITTTVGSVATAWENAFSVDGGGTITLCSAGYSIASEHDSLQFFGKEANNTVQLGNTEVMFVGVVEALAALDMNQVGVVWGEKEITLVGKVEKSVPEPTTGTLSLLALAGLCARRRRKK